MFFVCLFAFSKFPSCFQIWKPVFWKEVIESWKACKSQKDASELGNCGPERKVKSRNVADQVSWVKSPQQNFVPTQNLRMWPLVKRAFEDVNKERMDMKPSGLRWSLNPMRVSSGEAEKDTEKKALWTEVSKWCGCRPPSGAGREAWHKFSLGAARRNHPAHTLNLGFLLPDLWQNKFLLLSASQVVALGYVSPGTLRQEGSKGSTPTGNLELELRTLRSPVWGGGVSHLKATGGGQAHGCNL